MATIAAHFSMDVPKQVLKRDLKSLVLDRCIEEGILVLELKSLTGSPTVVLCIGGSSSVISLSTLQTRACFRKCTTTPPSVTLFGGVGEIGVTPEPDL